MIKNIWDKIKSVFNPAIGMTGWEDLRFYNYKSNMGKQLTFTSWSREGDNYIRKSIENKNIVKVIVKIYPNPTYSSGYCFNIYNYNNGTVFGTTSSLRDDYYSLPQAFIKVDRIIKYHYNAKFLSEKETDRLMLLM